MTHRHRPLVMRFFSAEVDKAVGPSARGAIATVGTVLADCMERGTSPVGGVPSARSRSRRRRHRVEPREWSLTGRGDSAPGCGRRRRSPGLRPGQPVAREATEWPAAPRCRFTRPLRRLSGAGSGPVGTRWPATGVKDQSVAPHGPHPVPRPQSLSSWSACPPRGGAPRLGCTGISSWTRDESTWVVLSGVLPAPGDSPASEGSPLVSEPSSVAR